MSTPEKFWSLVTIVEEDKCWEWNRPYFSVKYRCVTYRPHRLAYLLATNNKMSKNEDVIHICENDKCCNPKHLETRKYLTGKTRSCPQCNNRKLKKEFKRNATTSICYECFNANKRDKYKNDPKIKHSIYVNAYTNWPRKLIRTPKRGKDKLKVSITEKELLEMWDIQNGKCAATNIPFSLEYKGSKNLFFPSMDRIIAGGPYTKENVRLVCMAINYARNDASIEELDNFISAIIENK